MSKIDFSRFDWFDLDVVERVVTALQRNPEMGRPTLSKTTGLSMFKCEKVLEIWRDYDLYQYLDSDAPVDDINAALDLDDPFFTDAEDADESGSDEDWGFFSDTEGEGRFNTEKNYIYIPSKDLYVVTLKLGRQPRIVEVPGDTHRAMRGAYSHWDGDRATLNQIAKEFGVSRRWFHAYKTAMGWTHDQDPFTDAEVEQADPEELADRAIQRKRHVLERRYERKSAEQDKKDAEKFRELEHLVLDPLMDSLEHKVANLRMPTLELPRVYDEDEPFAAVISPADFHYGKLGDPRRVLEGYDRDTAKHRIRDHTQALLRDVMRFGKPEEIIVGMAGDWFHVDNAHMTTTSNKVGKLDVDGTLWQIIDEGTDLAIEFMLTLAMATDRLRIVKVRGNHDAFATLWLLKAMQLVARDVGGIEFVMEERDRTYLTYEQVLLGFTHGDVWNKSRTPRKILTEPPREMLARTVERLWFTGDKHFEKYENQDGIFWYQLPSLSGDDAWHDDNGFTRSRKALSGFILRPEDGVVGNLLSPVRRN